MIISIIIPAYNEEKTIKKIISKILSIKLYTKQIIVVDDGSTDNTRKIIRKNFSKKIIKIIYHTKKLGKRSCNPVGTQTC